MKFRELQDRFKYKDDLVYTSDDYLIYEHELFKKTDYFKIMQDIFETNNCMWYRIERPYVKTKDGFELDLDMPKDLLMMKNSEISLYKYDEIFYKIKIDGFALTLHSFHDFDEVMQLNKAALKPKVQLLKQYTEKFAKLGTGFNVKSMVFENGKPRICVPGNYLKEMPKRFRTKFNIDETLI